MINKTTTELSLEEIEPKQQPLHKPKQAPKMEFGVDHRNPFVEDRRQHPDRRDTIRFSDNRRSGKERRKSSNAWDDAHAY